MTTLLVCLALGCRGGHAEAVPPARGGAARPPSNVEIGRSMAAKRGWVGREWSCLFALWNRESGWQVHDPNPASQADGIAQANPASKMASAGPDWRDDATTQIRWGLDRYITPRYGTPCNAWAHSNAYGWY